MQTSENGLNLIKTFEGFRATAYPDGAGYSIAFGHQIKPGERFGTVTEAEGLELLRGDVKTAESRVLKTFRRELSQNEFDALVSFAFNLGGFSKAPQLVAAVNSGDRAAAAEKFKLYNRSNGTVSDGLINRRQREADLFLNGDAGEPNAPNQTNKTASGAAIVGTALILYLLLR